VTSRLPWKLARGRLIGLQQQMPDALERYVTDLAAQLTYSLRGFELVLDCANGAASQAAPALFERLGAGVEVFAAEPDGMNINDGCGATHPEYLANRTRGRLGLAFDGDADRLVAVDENGRPANGDVLMAVIAQHLKTAGKLDGNTVVVTVMSNFGFLKAMEDLGIDVVVTDVGDRYVLDAMRERRAVLGGEQSGHLIGADRTTGDGLATALRLLGVMAGTGKRLADLRTVMTEYPQVIRNVRVEQREQLASASAVWDDVAEVERELGGNGRVLVRASGTEPLVRVMVEASTSPEAAAQADRLAEVVRSELGTAGTD
jgi:phosphoglucosamine mutase